MSLSHVARLIIALFVLAALASLPHATPPAVLAQAPARVGLLHAAPVSGDTTVTFTVDGSLADRSLAALAYSQTQAYQDVAPGTRTFKLYPGSLTPAQLPGVTPLLTATITLEPGKDYTLVAVGGVPGFPLELLTLADNTPGPGSAAGKLRVVHVAPFAPPPAAVDVVAENGQAVLGLLNIAYKGVSNYVTLATGVSFDLKLVPTGRPADAPLLNLEPFSMRSNEVRTLVVLGGANGRSLTTQELSYATRGPTFLRVVHAAPFDGPESKVHVTLNGRREWLDLPFGQVTSVLSLDEGSYTIVVEQPGEPPAPLTSAVAQLRRGEEYVALIRPRPDGAGLILAVEPVSPNPSPVNPAPGQGILRVYHIAPFDTGDRSRVDIRNRRGELLAPELGALAFGDTVYVALPAREYDLLITSVGGDEIILLPGPFTLEADKVATLYIIGAERGRPSRTLVLADPVNVKVYLPFISRQ